ncbi:MAG: dCTP deaminase [bacterium]
MILVDYEIKRLILKEKGMGITPEIDFGKQIQPSSLDLRLGCTFAYISDNQNFLKLSDKIEYDEFEIDEYDSFVVKPNKFVLAETLEEVSLPNDISAFVEGRSGIGRAGLQVENAGWVDNGFSGTITLELKNLTDKDIVIKPGMRICQLVFTRTKKPNQPYQGKCLGQSKATGSKIYEDEEIKNGGI